MMKRELTEQEMLGAGVGLCRALAGIAAAEGIAGHQAAGIAIVAASEFLVARLGPAEAVDRLRLAADLIEARLALPSGPMQ